MSIQLKAKLFRYKELLAAIPMVFNIWALAGLIWIICGILDLKAASDVKPYFRLAMMSVFHGRDPGLREMQKAARQMGVIFLVAGILSVALHVGLLVVAMQRM